VFIKLRELNINAFKCVESKIPKFAQENDWAHNFLTSLTWERHNEATAIKTMKNKLGLYSIFSSQKNNPRTQGY
jgi:hypothetical protein